MLVAFDGVDDDGNGEQCTHIRNTQYHSIVRRFMLRLNCDDGIIRQTLLIKFLIQFFEEYLSSITSH